MKLDQLEVITLFVDDIAVTKSFYAKVFDAASMFGDEVSTVLEFGGVMINLLQVTEAPTLVEPVSVAPAAAGTRMLLTIKVDDVHTECARLQALGIDLLNGPLDRPWGRRTAAFADPSGHIWELAQDIA